MDFAKEGLMTCNPVKHQSQLITRTDFSKKVSLLMHIRNEILKNPTTGSCMSFRSSRRPSTIVERPVIGMNGSAVAGRLPVHEELKPEPSDTYRYLAPSFFLYGNFSGFFLVYSTFIPSIPALVITPSVPSSHLLLNKCTPIGLRPF